MPEEIIVNNKARIQIYKDKVVKDYNNKDRNIIEFKLLKELYSIYGVDKHNDWVYKFIEVFDNSSQDGIVMSRADGISLIDDPEFNDTHFYHAGYWLGYFHNKTRKGRLVKSFYDFSPSNLIISHRKKTITGIDPGINALTVKTYYFDILKFIVGCYISSFKRKTKFNEKCVNTFLKGYCENSKFIFKPDLYNISYNEVLGYIKSKSTRTRNGRVKFIFGYIILTSWCRWRLRRILSDFRN